LEKGVDNSRQLHYYTIMASDCQTDRRVEE